VPDPPDPDALQPRGDPGRSRPCATVPYGAASIVWAKAWSTTATRTVKVVVVGGTGRVDLDAFLILK